MKNKGDLKIYIMGWGYAFTLWYYTELLGNWLLNIHQSYELFRIIKLKMDTKDNIY